MPIDPTPHAEVVTPVLGIDCSGDRCSVAVASESGLEERSVTGPGEQLRLLLPLTLQLLEEVHLSPRSLVRVAVSIGPASFTGIRLALATARTFAQILDCPVVAVSTLDTIGYGLHEWLATTGGGAPEPAVCKTVAPFSPHDTAICVLTDARKRQIFAASYRGTPPVCVDAPRVFDPADAVEWLKATISGPTVVGGSAFLAYGDLLRGVFSTSTHVIEAPLSAGQPSARHVALAGSGAHGPVTLLSYAEVLPCYLRPPDVKKPVLPAIRHDLIAPLLEASSPEHAESPHVSFTEAPGGPLANS